MASWNAAAQCGRSSTNTDLVLLQHACGNPPGSGPATRTRTRLFDRADFSSSIALASITAKQTRFNAGLNGCFMDGLIYGSARITDLWIYESRMRSRCRFVFYFNANAPLRHRSVRGKRVFSSLRFVRAALVFSTYITQELRVRS